MSGYSKIDTCLLTSSLWCEAPSTKLVWITMLLLVNRHGEVEASIPGLAKQAGVSLEDTEKAIKILEAPDKYSRTKDFDGRRIEAIKGGWFILNHADYRDKGSEAEKQSKAAERTKRWRERKNSQLNSDAPVTPCDGEVTHGDGESDAIVTGGDSLQLHTSASTASKSTKLPPATPKVSSAKSKKETPEMRKLTDGFIEAYELRFERPYLFMAGRDGKAAATLLKLGLSVDDIIATAKEAWSNPAGFYCKHAITIHGLSDYWNNVTLELNDCATTCTKSEPTKRKTDLQIAIESAG